MTPHPHAEVLRALADGVPLGEFEITWGTKNCWGNLAMHREKLLDADTEVRRKQLYITVNGFEVPKPLEVVPPPDQKVFCVDFDHLSSLYHVWETAVKREEKVKMGIAHLTPEAAIAHAKAMLGINPEEA